jgi:DNA repair exonuclease SbcCD nuclease subunit
MEKDPVRGQDSMNTFREVLELARDNDVSGCACCYCCAR